MTEESKDPARNDPARPDPSGSERSEEAPTATDTTVTDPAETGPILSPSPQPRFAPGPDRRDGGPGQGWESRSEDDTAVSVLDRPADDVPLRERLARPGLARSTRILLLVLGAVVFLALGALLGRATAPATGPGSVPPTVGVVEAVDVTPSGFPVLTVRGADGTLTPLQTTPGTIVAVPQGAGLVGVRSGTQVTITGERDQRGQIIATRVDLAGR